MPKLYLSGPMSGIPEWNFPAFHKEAGRLRQLGYTVVNPAEINEDTTLTWHQCLRDDIRALCDCDWLVLLPGWEHSNGAHLELHIAHRLGLHICTADKITRPWGANTGGSDASSGSV